MLYKQNDNEPIPVAVKKTKLHQQRKRRLDTFLREVRALSRIKHSNCVKLYGVGSHEDFVFTVMELCSDGMSGWDFTRANHSLIKLGFPLPYLLSLAELAEGCAEMSKQGILHRDLTLDNILVFEDDDDDNSRPVFKICDFGVSATEDDKHLLPRGKMRNYPPEGIIDKMGYCPESDLYSFALIIWEMAHNQLVWDKYTTKECNDLILEGKLPEF